MTVAADEPPAEAKKRTVDRVRPPTQTAPLVAEAPAGAGAQFDPEVVAALERVLA